MNELVVPIVSDLINLNDDLKSIHPDKDASIEEKFTVLLTRDLARLGWRLKSKTKNSYSFDPPFDYDKSIVRKAMNFNRNEILQKNKDWIEKNLSIAQYNLANGNDALSSEIIPRFEVCENRQQRTLFRIYRYYWSSPYSEYVGRRIRLLIRDEGLPNRPVIGIAALGSSIIHIPDRDKWIGWDVKTRTERIVYTMDAYVLGALPPYNELLGGKLIAYMLASNEIREMYKAKYADQTTLIKNRTANDLALIITTSLYGKNSSQYNRIKYNNEMLYYPIGVTTGYGTLHISNETFELMKELLESKGYFISYRFGNGPNWRMRVIDTACRIMKLDSDVILKHSFQRGLYALPLAYNWREFLQGKSENIQYKNISLVDLVNYWKSRWYNQRIKNQEVVKKVQSFNPKQFSIL